MMAFVLAMPSPAGVVILMSIVHALLLASVRSWLGFIMTICKQTQCLEVGCRYDNVFSTYKCVHVNSYATQRTTWHASVPALPRPMLSVTSTVLKWYWLPDCVLLTFRAQCFQDTVSKQHRTIDPRR